MFQPPKLDGQHQSILFCQQPVSVLITPTAEAYVPLPPICDVLNIAWNEQLDRVQSNPLWTVSARSVAHPPNSKATSDRFLIALPIDHLARWLVELSDEPIHSDLTMQLWKHKEGCYRILLSEALRFAGSREAYEWQPDVLLMQSHEPFAGLYKRWMSELYGRLRLKLEQAGIADRLSSLERRMMAVEDEQR